MKQSRHGGVISLYPVVAPLSINALGAVKLRVLAEVGLADGAGVGVRLDRRGANHIHDYWKTATVACGFPDAARLTVDD